MACFSCKDLIINPQLATLLTCGHILCDQCTADASDASKCLECGVSLDIVPNNVNEFEHYLAQLVHLQGIGAEYLQHISEEHKKLTAICLTIPEWSQRTAREWNKYHRALIKSWATDHNSLSEILVAFQSAVDNYKMSLNLGILRAKFMDNFHHMNLHWQKSLDLYEPKFKQDAMKDIYVFHLPSTIPTYSIYVLVAIGDYGWVPEHLIEQIKVFPPVTPKSVDNNYHNLALLGRKGDIILKIKDKCGNRSFRWNQTRVYTDSFHTPPMIFMLGGNQIIPTEYVE